MAAGNLGVRVVDGNSGLAVPGACVRLRCGACVISRCLTNPDGNAEFRSVCTGQYGLTVTAMLYRCTNACVEIRANQTQTETVKMYLLRRIYFAIYYDVADNAFKRAADTWIAENVGQQSGSEVVLMKPVKTEADFRDSWAAVAQEAQLPGRGVMEGHLFTHASKGDTEDGLEFIRQQPDGTLGQSELALLPKLNWETEGRLVLHGCNTGLKGTRGWAPAEELAKGQGVKTVGQSGYSYFSRDSSRYLEIDAASGKVYLWAYRRGKNGALGDGLQMQGVEY
jgi:hypothetical protein